MPIEIKELVIRTVLESGSTSNNESNSMNIQVEVEKQIRKHKIEILDSCIELISDSLKRQNER
jgi:hypothetical protein